MGKTGIIPAEDAAKIRSAYDADVLGEIDIAAIDAIEAVTKHDVIAFLTWAGEKLGPEKRWLHQGMTSSDVLDTALAVQLKQAADLLIAGLDELLAVLKRRSLSVKIPAGVDEGTRIRVSGEGEAGVRNAANGDLYIFVHMKRHAIFQRDGTTLVAECPVSFTTAALGGSISLPGLDGEKIEIKIPAGIQSGEQLRQRGSGMTVLNGRGRGDLVARVLVETPRRMSSKQKKLLEEFRQTETGDECPASKSFFQRVRETFGS
jgi:hypothetical protein